LHVPLLLTSHCLSTLEPGETIVPSSMVTSSMKFRSLVHGPVVGVAVGRMGVGDAIGVVVGRTSVGMGCVGGTKIVDMAGGAQEDSKKIATENTESTELMLRVLDDLETQNVPQDSGNHMILFQNLRDVDFMLCSVFDYTRSSTTLRPIYISSSAAPPASSIGSPPISNGKAISPLMAFWRIKPSISAIRPKFWRR
jgi:hypothetical protein